VACRFLSAAYTTLIDGSPPISLSLMSDSETGGEPAII